MKNEITEDIKAFILGGNSSFTIMQDSVGEKKSVEVRYKVKKAGDSMLWFINTEIGDTKETVYQGYLKNDLSFNVGKKGLSNYNQYAVKGLIWVLNHAQSLPSNVHVIHHGKCSVCGRTLKDTDSLACGMGPSCRKKVLQMLG